MARVAVLLRARAEVHIIGAYLRNEILPIVEREYDRRLASGEDLTLTMPQGDEFARMLLDRFYAANRLTDGR